MSSQIAKNREILAKKRDSKATRQRAFIAAYPGTGFNASETCRQIGIARQTYAKWLVEDARFVAALDEAIEARLDEAEAALMEQVRQGNIVATIFFLKTQGKKRGYIEGSPVKVKDSVPTKAAEILDGVLAGSIKPEDAIIQFDLIGQPIPEGLRLLVQKSEVVEDPDEGWKLEEIEPELDRRYQERMAALEEQERAWLGQRRADVAEIKQELKNQDSFAADFQKSTKGGESPNAGNQ